MTGSPRALIGKVLTSAAVRQFDSALQQAATASNRSNTCNRAMYLLSEAANHSVLWHAINSVDALLGDRERRIKALRRSVILASEQALINGPVKMVTVRSRPSQTTEHVHAIRTPRTSSFPSGHASAGACAATLLARDLGHGAAWWTLAGLVSWSRVHAGVHYGSDVVAGLAAGTALATVSGRMWPPPTSMRISDPESGAK